jgi:hypothetical protein
VRSAGRSSGWSAARSEGGKVATVTASSRIIASSSGPACPRGAITSAAPLSSVCATSATPASKEKEANCSTRPPGSTPNASRCAAARFPIPRCGTTTPFGRPVDPEVKIT